MPESSYTDQLIKEKHELARRLAEAENRAALLRDEGSAFLREVRDLTAERDALRERLREAEEENARVKRFAFGDAPEWEKANTSLKHAVREAEARARSAEERLERLEHGGEKLAVQVRGYLAEAIEDDLNHPATRSPLAQGLNAWNDARNSLRPDRNEEARSGSLPDEEAG